MSDAFTLDVVDLGVVQIRLPKPAAHAYLFLGSRTALVDCGTAESIPALVGALRVLGASRPRPRLRGPRTGPARDRRPHVAICSAGVRRWARSAGKMGRATYRSLAAAVSASTRAVFIGR
jgi:hypothetical protein